MQGEKVDTPRTDDHLHTKNSQTNSPSGASAYIYVLEGQQTKVVVARLVRNGGGNWSASQLNEQNDGRGIHLAAIYVLTVVVVVVVATTEGTTSGELCGSVDFFIDYTVAAFSEAVSIATCTDQWRS